MKDHPLPSNWRVTTIGEVAAPVPNAIVDGPFGSNLKLNDYVENGVPVLQGKNITNDAFQWFDVRFISDRKANELKRSSVRLGDILLVKIGSIGYSAVIRDLRGFDFAIIPANLAKITPDPKIVDTGYLHKWLTSPDAKLYLERVASRTAQPALSLGKIKGLPIPLPPLAEQRRIAEVLDRAEALRAKRRAALAQLDTLSQAIFLDLFGDPATNPKGWPVKPFGDEIDSVRYGTGSPPNYVEEGVPFIRATNVKRGTISSKDLERISPGDAAELAKCKVSFGDLIVVRSGVNTGDCAIVPPEYHGACAAFDLIVELSGANSVFYNFLINSPYGKAPCPSHEARSSAAPERRAVTSSCFYCASTTTEGQIRPPRRRRGET